MNDHHHHHDHHHHNHSDDSDQAEMPMAEKLKKMVSHWLKHNSDHAETYRQWADRARKENLSEVAEILEKVADESQLINVDLEKAGQVLDVK